MSRSSCCFFFVALSCFVVAPAAASETDPFFAWFAPPKDGTAALNAAIDERLQRGLEEANASPTPLDCHGAARAMLRPLWTTALAYVTSEMSRWDVDRTPRTSTERAELATHGTYRYAPRGPVGWLVPLDPTVRVGDVLFGTDKLGHFFTNGPRYLDVFRARIAAGDDVAAAEAAAARFGVDQENGWLGKSAAGIFSAADLEANWRGMEFLRDLCAPATASSTTPRLVRRDGRWRLTAAFDISAWVNPCWDEAWNENAYDDDEAAAVTRAVVEMCPRWRRASIVERRARYAEQSCSLRHAALLQQMRDDGVVPDPRATSVVTLCAAR